MAEVTLTPIDLNNSSHRSTLKTTGHMTLVETIGWIGVVLYVLAYFAYSHGIISNQYLFVWLNTLAAVFVGWVSLKQRAIQSLVIQIVWIGIGLSALVDVM